MAKCNICGKRLGKGEKKYCKGCLDFHKHYYSKEHLTILRKEYERLNK